MGDMLPNFYIKWCYRWLVGNATNVSGGWKKSPAF